MSKMEKDISKMQIKIFGAKIKKELVNYTMKVKECGLCCNLRR